VRKKFPFSFPTVGMWVTSVSHPDGDSSYAFSRVRVPPPSVVAWSVDQAVFFLFNEARLVLFLRETSSFK